MLQSFHLLEKGSSTIDVVEQEPRTVTLPQRSLPYLILVGLFGLPISFLVSMLDPFLYSEKIRLLAPGTLRNTTLGLVTLVVLVVALVVQPLVGRWSDRFNSRWGRRVPFLVAGSIGVLLALGGIVAADSLWLLMIGAMLVSAASNTIQAAWQALIPDRVPLAQRGTAAGIKTVLELVGAIAGVGLVGYWLARGNLVATPLIASGLFLLVLLFTIYLCRQSVKALPGPGPGGGNPLSRFLRTLIEAPAAFRWLLLNRFLFWAAAIAIRTFLLNYLEDVIGLTPAESQALSSRLVILIGLGVLGLALPAGFVADKIGRRPILTAAGIIAATGGVFFISSRAIPMLFIGGGLIAAGTAIFASSSWALATDLSPPSKGALFPALANIATILGSMAGRLGGPIIDGLNWLFGTVALGYWVIFAGMILLFLGSSAVSLKIEETKE
ncbi:MAG TPA: MFS transporter [Anaerolineae bacterium]|nr:MFS transporter [Anaerolineae bacterium]